MIAVRAAAIGSFAVALAACRGGGATSAPHAEPRRDDVSITLYRDVALVRLRIDVDLPATPTALSFPTPLGIDAIAVLDRGGVAVGAIHSHVPIAPRPQDVVDDAASAAAAAAAGNIARLDPLEHAGDASIEVAAPRAGRYSIAIGYTTDRISWLAGYALETTPARATATLTGALAITNATGVRFERAHLAVIDAQLGNWRARAGEQIATAITGGAASTTPIARLRPLGDATLDAGETRIELAGISAPRELRSVLVYDPIGTALDNPGAWPERDPQLGVEPPAGTSVSESVEVVRDPDATAGLPAGTAELLERRTGGELALLGQARVFDDATRVAPVDTIPIGPADGVTATRRRLDLTVEDDVRHRLTEEFLITVDNRRPHPAEVLVREHLYRGQTWAIAYESTHRPAKEGAQQIALRADVPANAKAEITYVVVYSWKP